MRFVGLLLVAFALLPACAAPRQVGQGSRSDLAEPMAPTPAMGTARSPRKARIVEPTTGWPRKVEDVKGVVSIPAKPVRIHTLSVGYDEITVRLVDLDRLVAVGRSTTNPELSNVADLARQVTNQVGRNSEQIVALRPDLVVASPFANVDLVQQLRSAHIPLLVADLVS